MSTGTRCTTFTQLPLEFCAGSSANSALVAGAMVLTRPRHVGVGIGVGDHGDFLALAHVGELGFLEVGLDPHRARLDQAEDRHAALDALAGLQAHVADDAGGGRDHADARELVAPGVARGAAPRGSSGACPPGAWRRRPGRRARAPPSRARCPAAGAPPRGCGAPRRRSPRGPCRAPSASPGARAGARGSRCAPRPRRRRQAQRGTRRAGLRARCAPPPSAPRRAPPRARTAPGSMRNSSAPAATGSLSRTPTSITRPDTSAVTAIMCAFT